jgi:hypothetical protein
MMRRRAQALGGHSSKAKGVTARLAPTRWGFDGVRVGTLGLSDHGNSMRALGMSKDTPAYTPAAHRDVQFRCARDPKLQF